MSGTVVLTEKWPVLARHEVAAGWLQVWTDLGRAPRTIDAYARGLAEYLVTCEREGNDPLTANRADIAGFVRELTERPSRRGVNVVSIDSGSGLANATIQQRIVPVRLFYDFLIVEGLRESNPVGRGRYTPGRRRGGPQRGLVPRFRKLPWIPSEQEWLEVLRVAAGEPIRNRVIARAGLRRRTAARGVVLAAHRGPRPGSPNAAGAGGDDEEPVGAGGAVLRADRGPVVGVFGASGDAQSGPRAAVPCRSPGATTHSR